MKASYIHTWEKQQETVTQLASGVTYISSYITCAKLQEAVKICTVDLSDPYTEVQVASARGGVGQLATVRELAQEYLVQGKQVVAAINGDFFSHLGVPSGLQIVNGEIICSPLVNKVAMVIMADRTVRLLQNIQMLGSVTSSTNENMVDAVNRTRGLNHENHLFVYTSHFGQKTNTPQGGVEVVCECLNSSLRLKAGETLKLKVVEILEQGNSPIEPGGIVLSASGEKARWLQNQLKQGSTLDLTVSYDQGVNDAKQVLSGNSKLAYPLIIDGQLAPEILDENDPFYSDRHPRTMIALKDDQLHIVVIDGRQPGYSDGVTLTESAYYLQSLGMEQAINIDGGGSSTYLYRPLGENSLELANRPSDGFERSVGNGLVVLNTAKATNLASLHFEPTTSKVLLGSILSFKVKGVDENLNPVSLNHSELDWQLTGNLGRLLADGTIFVEKPDAEGILAVTSGQVSAKIRLHSVDNVHKLSLKTERTVVEPGSSTKLQLSAWDQNGQEILLSPDAVKWSVQGEIGKISSGGELVVSDTMGIGVVSASYGAITTEQEIQIGQDPLVLVNFESTQGLKLISRNVVEGSVSFSQVSRPNPIRFGAFSGKVTYDFTGQTGHSSVSIALLNQAGEIGREIPGKPKRFGIWVYGDGQGHWLRLVTTDGAANDRNLDFTPLGGLNWIGWRYVTLDVPPNTVYPITVRSIVVIEPNDANKNAGIIYFDHFRAEYIDLDEDVEGPVLSDLKPEPQSYLKEDLTTISFKVEDHHSGVNANSIRMWINHKLVKTKYNGEGVVTFQPEKPFAPGEYQIQVEVTDNVGNPCLPVNWSFQVGR